MIHDGIQNFLELLNDLVLLESGQALKFQIQNRLGLNFGKPVAGRYKAVVRSQIVGT